MSKTPEQLLCQIAGEIWEKQGVNTLALDLRPHSTITDFYLVSEGQVDRHVKSLATAVIDSFAKEGYKPLHIEGWAMSDWIVLDYAFCIVHLFLPQMRHHYCLEEIWKEARLVDLHMPREISTSTSLFESEVSNGS